MIRRTLGVQLDRLLEIFPRPLLIVEVVLRLGQQVIGRVVVPILQQRFQGLNDTLPILLAGINIPEQLPRLHMIGRRLQDSLKQRFSLLFLAGIPIRPGQMHPIARLGLILRGGFFQQLDRLRILPLKHRIRPLFKQLLRLGNRRQCRRQGRWIR